VLPNPLRRVAMLIGALPLLALAGPVASASAEVESSKITSPSGPTNLLFNATTESHESKILTIKGTTTGAGKIEVRCYYGPEVKDSTLVVKEFEPLAHEFSVEVAAEDLLPSSPCVLRAVPGGDSHAHPPGGAADPFEGPEVAVSEFSSQKNSTKTAYDYDFAQNTLSGYFNFVAVGACGLDFSNLVAPSTLEESEGLFDCNAALYAENHPSSGPLTRSELQIDGANAYSPVTANQVAEELETKTKAPVTGVPQVTVTQHFNDPSAALVTIEEADPIVKCAPESIAPPTPTSCKEFVATGVELKRTWQTSSSNRVAAMTDTWISTNGATHSLNALYDQETANEGKEGGAYEFPGTNVFSHTVKGETVSLPAGLGRIYYKSNSETSGEGDGKHPQGAIVYDTPPSGPISVYRGTATKEGYNGFEMPYQATIPAGGSYTLRMAFVQAYKLSEVEALSSEVLAGYPPSAQPALSITSPANGVTVSSPSVTVSGTVTDKRVITSFTVDGKAVTVGTSGVWSTSVTLNKGANTITALATDQAGFSTEKSVSVTYTPPPPPVAHASQVGTAKGKNGEVTFSLTCKGTAGTACEIEATLTTIEKLRHGKPVAVSARRHPRTRTEAVTVGSSSLTIPAGQKVTISIPLNATGKGLLAKFGALPVHLSVVQVSSGHRSTVIAQNLTVTTHRRTRHHHHHHHHHR
jgi:Glucodextranase, domain B